MRDLHARSMKSRWKTTVFNRYGGEMWLYKLIATVDALLAIFSASVQIPNFRRSLWLPHDGAMWTPEGPPKMGNFERPRKILKGVHRRGRVRLAPGAVSGGTMPSLRQQQLPFQPPAVSFKGGALATFFTRRRLQGGSSLWVGRAKAVP